MAATTVQQTECPVSRELVGKFLNTPFLITDPTERQYLRWLVDRGLFRQFRHLSSGHSGRHTTGTRSSSIQLTSAWSTRRRSRGFSFPGSGTRADRRSRRTGTFLVSGRDFQRGGRQSFARVGHRVRFAEKVCRAVYNHSTGRIDFYLLTVITGLSLSLVQSRSWSSPWSSPSVAATPVAVGCSCPVCVRRFYPWRMWHMGILWWSCCAGLLYSCSDEFLAVAGHSLATGRVDGARCSDSALSWASPGFGGCWRLVGFRGLLGGSQLPS